MCDARKHVVGFVLLTEENTDTAEITQKFYAPVTCGSRRFTTGQMSSTIYASEFLGMNFAFDEFGHLLWEVKKPAIVMAFNEAINRSLRAKQIPRKFWNF